MEDIAIACNSVYHFFTWTKENEKELASSEQESPAAEQTMENSTGESASGESEKDDNTKRIEKLEKIITKVYERLEETDGHLREKQQEIAQLKEQKKNYQEFLKQAFTKLANAIVEWKELRWEITNKLETVTDMMEKKKNDTNIGEFSGTVVGLAGTGLTIAGLILTPFTGKWK